MSEHTYICADGTVLDLHAEMLKILRLPYVRGARKSHRGGRFVPKLKVRDKPVTHGRFNRDRGAYSGFCTTSDGSIVLSLRKGKLDSVTVRMILLHEVCHSVGGSDWHHGRKWQTLYRRAANAYFGIDLPPRSATGHRSKYAIDKNIVHAVQDKEAAAKLSYGQATVSVDGVEIPGATLESVTLAWEGDRDEAVA